MRDSGSFYYENVGKEVNCIDSVIPFDVPDCWVWVRLKHISEVIGGGTPKTSNAAYWDGDIPWITPADLSGYDAVYLSCGERFITARGLTESSAKLLPKGAVLYSRRTPIAYVAIAENPVATNQGFKSVSPYYQGMSLYLYYCLKARTDDIILRAS